MPKKQGKRNWLFLLLKVAGLGFLFVSLLAGFLIWSYVKDLPRPEKFTERIVAQSTKIYDRTGKILLYEIFGEEKRTVVPLNKISPLLQEAVLAAEDSSFYEHRGFSLRGIIRAVLADFRLMSPVQGASTISQQLIRSSYLGQEKTSIRKTREIILTFELERRYSKDQILEFYLNQIPFGQNAYGAEAAARAYFKKSASDISLAESALLASLIKSPSYLSPYGPNKDQLLARKDYVLDRMKELGFISPEQASSAKKETLEFSKIAQGIKAPHFTLWIKSLLEEKYGEAFLREKGLRVYTSLDWELQQEAEKAISDREKINRSLRAYNAAAVVIDTQTGDILSMVGSKNFFGESEPKDCQSGKNCLFEPQFNVALASRQPGSSFKPFVYATTFEKGYDDKTTVVDEETNFGVWGGKEYVPKNYDGLFRGVVTLRQALAQSLNIPSIKALLWLAGLEDSVKTARNLGISTLNPPFGPSIVLGGYEVRLLEMVSAYGAFANNGLWLKSRPIIKIENVSGQVLEENQSEPKRVLSTKTANLLSDILSDNEARAPIFGLNSPLFFEGKWVAAKTGTTQDYRDGWTVGYTPSVVVGVWTGNNDNSPIAKEPGGSTAGPIFHQLMEKTIQKLNPERHE